MAALRLVLLMASCALLTSAPLLASAPLSAQTSGAPAPTARAIFAGGCF